MPGKAPPSKFAHLVAGTTHGEDDLRPHGIGLDLGAQAVDVGRHGVLVAIVRVTPHRIEQLGAREHMARVRGEMQQEIELERREVEQLAALANLALGGQDFERAVADGGRNFGGAGERRALQGGAPQQGFDAGQQLGERERLGEVVVSTELEAEHAVELGGLGGEHQDRRGAAACTERFADLEFCIRSLL